MATFVNDEIIRISKSLDCGHCGCKFSGSHSQARKVKYESRTVYCSSICRLAGNAKKKHKPIPERGPCPTCGKRFMSRREKKFCSMDCYMASDTFDEIKRNYWGASKEKLKEISERMKTGEEKPCLECGESYYAKPSLKQKFCSTSCYRSFMASRFDRWIADPQDIALPQCYDEFMDQQDLPCLVDGCDWHGKHLALHINLRHGIDSLEFKRAAGFNLTTGLVGKDLHKKLSEQNIGRGREDIAQFSSMANKEFRGYVSLERKEHAKKSRSLASNCFGPQKVCKHCKKSFIQSQPFGAAKFCSVECRSDSYADAKRVTNKKTRERNADGTFRWV